MEQRVVARRCPAQAHVHLLARRTRLLRVVRRGDPHLGRALALEARVAEQGSHDDLMARHGLYAELYGIQARAYQ